MSLSNLSLKELYDLREYLKSNRLKKIVENNDSYDYKFAYHLVRLAYECEQILAEGDLDLQRPKEHLKAIRRGEVKEQEIRDWFSLREKGLEKLYQDSKLQYSPDMAKIKQLLINCLEHHYGSLEDSIVNVDKATQTLREIQQLIQKRGF